jgi:hypothetical protein
MNQANSFLDCRFSIFDFRFPKMGLVTSAATEIRGFKWALDWRMAVLNPSPTRPPMLQMHTGLAKTTLAHTSPRAARGSKERRRDVP